MCGILEDPDILDLFLEVPSDVESGVPLINVDIVDCGVNTEAMDKDKLFEINKKLRSYQLDDLAPSRKR